MEYDKITTLGRTGLKVGKMGIASAYGISEDGIVKAFENGINYFYWGALRRSGMKTGIKKLITMNRDKIVIVLQTHTRSGKMLESFVNKKMKILGIDYFDILLIGGTLAKKFPEKLIERSVRLKEKGMIKFLGAVSHNRKLFPELEKEGIFDVYHIRYNASHRGAETDIFPYLKNEDKTGIVTFTALNYKRLMKSKKIPVNEIKPSATDCYRFVLSNPSVDVCIAGPSNINQLKSAIEAMKLGPLNEEKLAWMREIGDYVYGRKVNP